MKTRILKKKDGSYDYYRGRDWVGWYFPNCRFARVITPNFSEVPQYVGVGCRLKVCEFSGTCKDCPYLIKPTITNV